MMDVYPNSRNVIPGRVSMSVDFRADNDKTLLDMDAELRNAAKTLAESHRVNIDIKQVVYFPPQAFTPSLVDAIRTGARALDLSEMDIVSGAGHDAVYLARIAPTAMIFIPCKDGISHNEIEDALPEHIEAGCNVLLQAMLNTAGF